MLSSIDTKKQGPDKARLQKQMLLDHLQINIQRMWNIFVEDRSCNQDSKFYEDFKH